MGKKTLQQVFTEVGGNFFDVSVTGVDLSLPANGSVSVSRQKLISNLTVPIYPVVIEEAAFKETVKHGVDDKLDELRALDAAFDTEHTGTVQRKFASRQVTDVRGARERTSTHGEQQTTDARGATRATDAKGQVSITDTIGTRSKTDVYGAREETYDYAKKAVDVNTDAETDNAQTVHVFDDQVIGSQANVVEPSTGTSERRGAKHTQTVEAARTDVKGVDTYTDTHNDASATDTHVTAAVTDTHSTDAVTDTQTRGQYTDTDADAAYTDTHTEGAHTDTEYKELTFWEIAKLHEEIDAAIYSILRGIIVEAVAAARGCWRYGAF
jgi:hypothetical protein